MLWSTVRPLISRPTIFTRSPCRLYCKDAPPAPVKVNPLYIKEYHEPKYLEALRPKVPYYEYYNIQIKGYDFATVESFAKLVNRLCKDVGLSLNNYWAVPSVVLKYETYADESSHIENTEEIKIHTRTVQVKNMTTTQLAILVDAVNQGKPAGVIVSFMEHQKGHEDVRYIPDLKLAALEKELGEAKEPVSVLGKS